MTWFSTPLLTLDGYPVMPFRLFQHASTVLGLMLLLWWIYRWYQKTSPKADLAWQPSNKVRLATLFTIISIPSLAAMYFTYKNTPSSDVLFGLHSLQHGIKSGIVGGGAVFILTTAAIGIFYQYLLYRDHKILNKQVSKA